MSGRPAVAVLAVLMFVAAALVASAAFQIVRQAPEIAVDWDALREFINESPSPTPRGATARATAAGAATPLASVVRPGDPIGRRFADQGKSHVSQGTTVSTYNSTPPTSGPHWPAAYEWGVYTAPLADEGLVHNLEHGGIVISHNVAADVESRLRQLRASYRADRFGSVKIIVRPYDKIPRGQIALTAWTWLDVLDTYDETRIRAFITAHMNQCCEDVP